VLGLLLITVTAASRSSHSTSSSVTNILINEGRSKDRLEKRGGEMGGACSTDGTDDK
jgi:hypothetical protein